MSKKPKLEHEYHAGKDKLKIAIQGYALKSKAARNVIVKLVRDELEQNRTRQTKDAKKSVKKVPRKKQEPREDKAIEIPG